MRRRVRGAGRDDVSRDGVEGRSVAPVVGVVEVISVIGKAYRSVEEVWRCGAAGIRGAFLTFVAAACWRKGSLHVRVASNFAHAALKKSRRLLALRCQLRDAR